MHAVKRYQFSIRVLLLIVTISAVITYALRPRSVAAKITVTGFSTEIDESGSEYVAVHVAVQNESPNGVFYPAINEGSPSFGTEQYRGINKQITSYAGGSKWIKWHRLEPQQKLTFSVPLFADTTKFRLGLTLYSRRRGKPTPVWTEIQTLPPATHDSP